MAQDPGLERHVNASCCSSAPSLLPTSPYKSLPYDLLKAARF
jgi:hypothetical protein